MLETIHFEKFTAFEDLRIEFSPGINIFIGENGTGKTHILKAAYAACDIAKSKDGFAQKINRVFLPSGKKIGRLVKRSQGRGKGALEVVRRLENGNAIHLRLSISTLTVEPKNAKISGSTRVWKEYPHRKLEKIREGEAPLDIFVRWKPMEEQPIGWEPDIDDGVRLNIRPFMTAGDIRKKGAGVLREKPHIHWKKDRGKDVPWFPQFQGDRINDHHLNLEEKRAARRAKEGSPS